MLLGRLILNPKMVSISGNGFSKASKKLLDRRLGPHFYMWG